jgi:cold-inducible RNA-binding protein
MTTQLDRLFVAGLDYDVDDHQLAEHFDPSGRVTRAIVILDKETNRSKGFGFVSFVTPSDAAAALEALDGSELLGRRITVKYAEDNRPPRGMPPRPARGGAP